MNKNLTATLLVSATLGVVLAFVAAAGAIALLPGDGPSASNAFSLVVDRGEDPTSEAMSLASTEPVNEADAMALAVAPAGSEERDADGSIEQDPPASMVAANTRAAALSTDPTPAPDTIVTVAQVVASKVAQAGVAQLPAAQALFAGFMSSR